MLDKLENMHHEKSNKLYWDSGTDTRNSWIANYEKPLPVYHMLENQLRWEAGRQARPAEQGTQVH